MYKPKYFKEVEFARCNPPCELSDMSEDFLRCLDDARQKAKVPFRLTSAYRSIDHERSKGRNGTSSHCKGVAVDISCGSSYVRGRILYGLIQAGFNRIGLYRGFIHADLDLDKISAVWLDDNFVSSDV